MNGHIGELLVAGRILSNTGRQAMEITLPISGGGRQLPNSHLLIKQHFLGRPVISRTATASGTVGSAFSYTIVTNVANPLTKPPIYLQD